MQKTVMPIENIPDDLIVNRVIEWVHDADVDELCHIVGEIFGGYCEYVDETEQYTFTPNEDYMGAFDQYNIQFGN